MLSTIQQIWMWIFDRFILYPLMRWIAPKLGVKFMNLGYVLDENDQKIKQFLERIPEYETNGPEKAHLNLYEKALSLHDSYPTFENLEILEVSCGQANSLKWIQRHHGPKSLIGCDKIVSNSKNLENVIYGDAQNLPFKDNSFDIVLNVEASHLYMDCAKFFEEVHRVLRPNGYFLWLDLRYPNEVEILKRTTSRAGLKLEILNDITGNVICGLHETTVKYDRILKKSPKLIQLLFSNVLRTTYCAPGTQTYNRLVKRERLYLAGKWTKP
ncbi:unnamed protein product [Caenorhabditis angaria]|uniref:Methyltransferase type 11 domain-containing protein n=1 Tax=Caenorhabditis angaria TaxID=860376 RepID=A0A9P1N296_9PELO|nr:unnamed protein product [Caenorhabditis angaria]